MTREELIKARDALNEISYIYITSDNRETIRSLIENAISTCNKPIDGLDNALEVYKNEFEGLQVGGKIYEAARRYRDQQTKFPASPISPQSDKRASLNEQTEQPDAAERGQITQGDVLDEKGLDSVAELFDSGWDSLSGYDEKTSMYAFSKKEADTIRRALQNNSGV